MGKRKKASSDEDSGSDAEDNIVSDAEASDDGLSEGSDGSPKASKKTKTAKGAKGKASAKAPVKKKGGGDKNQTEDEKKQAKEHERLKNLAYDASLIESNPIPDDIAQVEALALPASLKKGRAAAIVNKAARGKKRFLFMFPGRMEINTSNAKVGTIMHLDTRNPELILDFSQGRLKLTGTFVFPKSRYLAVSSTGATKAKDAVYQCRGAFDSIVVFSQYQWIGKKEDNPTDAALPLPEELRVPPKKEAAASSAASAGDVDVDMESEHSESNEKVDRSDFISNKAAPIAVDDSDDDDDAPLGFSQSQSSVGTGHLSQSSALSAAAPPPPALEFDDLFST